MNGKSLDPNDERITQLKNLFPEVFNENNINFDKLKEILSKQIPDKKEFYQLSWAGKNEARKEIQKQTTATLNRPALACVPTSKTPAVACVPTSDKLLVGTQATASHILIEGENLEVLRTLQKAYFNKIKMIYIDPPYNTGNDSFVYPDDYKEKKAEYQKRAGIKDENGSLIQDVLFQKNNKDNGQFHSVWLSMMYPRLFLARNLLTDDGVIFISIDDNEAANLKLLCDEIFGEENFVASYYWMRTSTPPSLSIKVRKKFEIILCYQKNQNNSKFIGGTSEGGDMPLLNEVNSKKELLFDKNSVFFKIKDGFYDKGIYDKVELLNDIIVENGKSTSDFKLLGNFKWKQELLDDEIKNGTVFYIKSDKFSIRYERTGERIKIPSNIISKTECNVGTNEDGVKNIEELFGLNYFDYPKPVSLIKYLVNFCCNKSDLILDFFAGSGTTAQAVMELNEEDGGNRQCICVQLPEPLDEKSEAHKAGYITIADITKARIEKVIEKISKAREGKIDFVKKPLPSFEHYILAESNFKIWQSEFDNIEELHQQLEVFQESQKAESTPENMLLELLLKLGFGFDTAVKEIQLIDNQCIYAVEKNILWVYFGKYNIDFLEKIIQNKPKKIIVLDSCFDDDVSLKNFELELKEKEIQLIII